MDASEGVLKVCCNLAQSRRQFCDTPDIDASVWFLQSRLTVTVQPVISTSVSEEKSCVILRNDMAERRTD